MQDHVVVQQWLELSLCVAPVPQAVLFTRVKHPLPAPSSPLLRFEAPQQLSSVDLVLPARGADDVEWPKQAEILAALSDTGYRFDAAAVCSLFAR